MKKYLIIILTLISLAGFSQYNVSDGGTVYVDSLTTVGPGSISVGNTYTYTICATAGYDNHHISVAFPSDFSIPAGSNICVYDGPNIGAPLIDCYNNTNFGTNHAFIASCANLTGCLTLVLDVQDAGISFTGEIKDNFCCQNIEINLTTTPTMIGGNIDICPGDAVTMNSGLSFPTFTALAAEGHNWGYAQDASTCTYLWDLGDGTTPSTASVTHTYASVPPSGYSPSLQITDAEGCNNTNVITPHVRMSLIPDFSGVHADPLTLCQDEITSLLCGNGPDGAGITSDTWYSAIIPIYADTTFLPDGTGASYTTSIIFDQFTPFATLDNINLLGGIWLSMEHSYIGDLNISITCPPPASHTVDLHLQGGGGTYLGVPVDVDSDLSIGECWDYGWTPGATNGTWVDNASGTLPSGTYESEETLNNLLGCPLNGQWVITIQDNWASDNGYICSWWIDWDPSLFPEPWTYNMNYTAVSWGAPSTNGEVLTGATASCNGTGTYHEFLGISTPEPRPFIYTVVDNFGCVYDTTIQVTWLNDDATQCCIDPVPDLGSPEVLCGFIYDLHVYNGFTTPGNTGTWELVSGPGSATFTPDVHSLDPSVEVTMPGVYTFSWTEINMGCTTTVSKQVEFKLKPNAFAGLDHDICGTHESLSATSSAAGNTFYWYSDPTTGVTISSPTSQNTDVDVTTYGLVSFYVVESNGTCSDTSKIKVNFLEIPVAVATGNDVCGNTVCLDATLQAGFEGYWTGPAGAYYDASDTIEDPCVTILPWGADPTHTETFVWHVNNGICPDDVDVPIVFSDGGLAANPGNNDQVCGGWYQMAALPGLGGHPTVWSCPDPRLDILTPNDPLTWISIDTNLIDWTDSSQVEFVMHWTVDNTASGGCFVTSSVTITFFQTPEADAGPDRPICGLHYNLAATPSIAAWEGEWVINYDSIPTGAQANFGDGSTVDSEQPHIEVTVTEYGVYQFIWHELNANHNCRDADTVTIEFIRIPDIDAGDPQHICGWRTQMEAIMDPSGTSAYGTWQNAPIYWTDSTFWYDTPHDTLGIGDIANQDAAEQSSPIAYITNPVSEQDCSDTVMMVWQEYSLGQTFSHQCVSKDTVMLYFFADIYADNSSVTIEPEVCGLNIDLTNAQDVYCAKGYWVDSLGIVTTWNPGYDYHNTTATNGAFGQNAFAYVIENGWYGASNTAVCSDTSDYLTVIFKQQPQVDACPGCFSFDSSYTSSGDFIEHARADTVCFDDLSDYYQLSPFKNIGDGTWSKSGAGTWFANAVTTNTSVTQYDSLFATIFNSSGASAVGDYYTLVWTSTSSTNGCEDKDTLLLSIAKNPSGDIGYRRPYCHGESAMIWAEEDHDADPTMYNWQFADNPVIDSTESGSSTNPDSLLDGAHYVRWTTDGDCDHLIHQVTMVSSSTWGCVSKAGIANIKEPEVVYPQFNNVPATCGQNNGTIIVINDSIRTCNDTLGHTILTCWQSSTLQEDLENPYYPGDDTHQPGVPSFENQTNFGTLCVVDSLYGLSPSDTSVVAVDYLSLITLDPGFVGEQRHCKDTLVLTVEDSGHITAIINDEQMTTEGTAPLAVTMYHGTADASKYIWIIRDEDGNIIEEYSSEYPMHTFPEGTYEVDLVVKSREGCYDTTFYRYIVVDSESFIEIPNVFTPNGDGSNDYFQVYAKSLKSFSGFIMNRWGKVVYEWEDWTTEDKGWDGTINGGSNIAGPGVYFYVIRYKGVYDENETEVKGALELVREKE